MPSETRLDDLLRCWEDGQRRGNPVAPEDLCRDCPELLEPLRQAVARLRQVDQLSGTIGPPGDTELPPAEHPPSVGEHTAALPVPAPNSREPDVLPEVRLRPGAEPVPGFRLVRELGVGGYGSVWLAEAPGGFPVAVKFVALIGRPGASEVRSLEVLRRLHHPNLLTTFGAWQTPGHLVVAMELADRTLADRLAEAREQGHPGIPGPELLGYLRGAARALDYLNRPHHLFGGEPQGVLHRDVKPQNLLLVGDTVKVGDFGLARALERTVASHSGGLTPAYAAPEFFAGQAARQSDQYSLAVTYCELRGGRLPFAGDLGEQLLGHIRGEPDLGMLPVEERPAVARALSKKPADRWPSCTDFVEALAASPAGDAASPAPALPATELLISPQDSSEPPIPLTRPTRRRATRFAGLLMVGIAVVAAAVVLSLTSQPPSPPTPKWENPRKADIKSKPSDVPTPPDPGASPPTPTVGPSPTGVAVTPGSPRDAVTTAPPPRHAAGERMRFGRHSQPARAVAWVPGTGRVLSGGVGGELWMWDAQTGEGARRLNGLQDTIHCVAVSNDGRRALTGVDDMTVRLWDLDVGREEKTLRKKRTDPRDKEFEVYGVAFVDSRRAVSAGNANIAILWDLVAGAEAGRLETGLDEVLGLGLSADGRLLLGGARGRLILRGLAGDEKGVAYPGHADDVLAVAFFPDGERFVSVGGGDGQEKGRGDYIVRLWRRGNLKPVELRGHEARVTGVAVSPDGRRVLSGDAAGNLRLWDADAGVELPRFDKSEGGKSAISCVAISPDGAEAVTGHEDGKVRVWTLPR